MTATRSQYCFCGAAVQISSTQPDLADLLCAEFDERHTGGIHGPCTQAQAATARRREERRALRAARPDTNHNRRTT